MKICLLLSIVFLLNSELLAQATHKQVNSGIPELSRQKLNEYLQQKRDIHQVESTKEGHWFILGTGVRYWSSATFFNQMTGRGSMSLRQKIDEYLAAGRKIDAVGITNDNNWVIVSGNLRYYSSASKFDELKLRDLLDRLINRGAKITSIAIDRNDQWTLIADGVVYYSQNIPADLNKAILDSRTQKLAPRLIKFRPGTNQWLFLAGQKTWHSNNLSAGLVDWSNKYRNFKWQVDQVFLTPGAGWAVISNQQVPTSTASIEQLEWSFNAGRENLWQRIEHHKSASVAIGLIENGRLNVVRSYGYADYTTKRFAYTDTVFAVASMSKAVGAAAFVRAAEVGHISMTKGFNNYVDAFPNNSIGEWGTDRRNTTGMTNRLEKTNYLRLLSHTAGLNKHGIGVRLTPTASLADVLLGDDGEFVTYLSDAGTSYRYSGGGYTAAEIVLELSQNKTATQYMNDMLTRIGMTSSTFGSMQNNLNNLARLHNKDRQLYTYRECPVKSAGGLFTTVNDYANFLHLFMNQGKNRQGLQVLRSTSIDLMMTPIHHNDSSRDICSSDLDCSGNERCFAKNCMIPIRNNWEYLGLGLKLEAPISSTKRLPTIIHHGGAQLSTRTYFILNLATRQGLIVFTSGERSWKNDESDTLEAFKGTNPLINEITANYRSLIGW